MTKNIFSALLIAISFTIFASAKPSKDITFLNSETDITSSSSNSNSEAIFSEKEAEEETQLETTEEESKKRKNKNKDNNNDKDEKENRVRSKDKIVIESIYDVDSLRISDLYMQAIREKNLYGNISKAYSIFNAALEIDSMHAPSLYQTAAMSGNIKNSLNNINRAIEVDSTNIDYLYLQILLLRQDKQYDGAITVIDKLLKNKNRVINLHLQKAQTYDEGGMPFAAISTLDSAKTLFGNQPEILSYMQELYSRLKMSDKAIEAGRELVKQYPEDQKSLISLAMSYASNSDLEEATKYFDQAKMIDSTSLTYQATINEFYQQYGSPTQYLSSLVTLFSNRTLPLNNKIDYFNNVIKKPEFYQKHYIYVESLVNTLRATYTSEWSVAELYATHLINIGKTREASNVYLKYLSDTTNQKKAYQQVIGIESYLKEDSVALLKYCDDALKIFKEDSDMKLMISTIYSTQNRVKEAIKISEECVKEAKDDSTKSAYIGYIGDLYYQIGNMKKCYSYYEKALKFDKNNVMVLNNYSYFLSEEGKNLEKALTMASLVMSIEPDNPTYIDTYGWILYKLGRYEQARDAIRRAIALDTTNSSELLIHLGDIFKALGNTTSAEIYWNRAINAGADKEKIEKRKNGEATH